MNQLGKFLFVSFLVLSSPFLSAQQCFFQTFGKEAGIPVSTVNDIAEDPLGFMWIATEGGGVARFDGVKSVVYTTDDGLPSDYVTSLLYKEGVGLIVGTDKGVMIFNGYSFESLMAIPAERVVALTYWEDDLVVVNRRGLWILTGDSTATHYTLPGDPELMSVDATTDLYVGASDGLWKFTGSDWEHWWTGSNVRSILIPNPEDDQPGIQVGAADDVYLILRKEIAVKNLSTADALGAHPDVRDIVQDEQGRWWYGSYQEGLRRFNAADAGVFGAIAIREDQGLPTPKVRCMYVSSDGRIWIGGLTGLSRLVEPDLFRLSLQDGLVDERIHALSIADNGDWWMGGMSGLSVRSVDGKIQNFTSENGLPKGLLFDLARTKSGDLFVATENGLAKRSGAGFVVYGPRDGLGNGFIFDLEPLSDGRLAVATSEGIYIYNRGRFRVLDIDLTTAAFVRVQEDGEGNLWALDIEGRIYKSEGERWHYAFDEKSMLRIGPSTFQVDENDVLWVGTNGNGLWRYEDGMLDSLVESQGLLSNNVWSLEVQNNDIWIGTDIGIQNLYWNDGWGFGTRISEARGFGSLECNPHAIVRGEKSIIFGTNDGVLVAPLRKSDGASRAGKLQLMSVDLYFEQPDTWIDWSTGIEPWIGLPLNLILPYDQNYLRFNYTALQVADAEVLQYQYKLSPLNAEWTEAEGRTEAIYTNVPPGKYTFELRAFDPLNGTTIHAEPYTLVIKSPFWKTWWFYVLISLSLAGIVMLYIRVRINRINVRIALEEERNDLERRALRLQMNPHFIFNALDAISGFIFKNEPKEAVKYLNNFAKLMRLMLESSREHVIPIHTEIQLLRNYIALEQLRFSGEFDSEIVIDEDLDTYGWSMPSMMVQPHVENAILHGLRPAGKGKVIITFSKVEEGLKCVVEDNGVGRRKSAELHEKGGRNHRSLAGEISRRRVELFEKTYGGRSAVLTEDLFDEDGNSSGTRVILQLPLQALDEWDED